MNGIPIVKANIPVTNGILHLIAEPFPEPIPPQVRFNKCHILPKYVLVGKRSLIIYHFLRNAVNSSDKYCSGGITRIQTLYEHYDDDVGLCCLMTPGLNKDMRCHI